MRKKNVSRRLDLVKLIMNRFNASPAMAFSRMNFMPTLKQNDLYDEYWLRECELQDREYEV
ncbi:hypothetical protein [Prochlorococcus sp. MIT 1300]|uniref:hypothetical protein n=1 Tax=Prochlorococcus sp. MIT 1300 TaxID=3096218 RepID=UPI002A749F56|nr:hypothetical protein [Prochlorococcus sp. MIT 1300]